METVIDDLVTAFGCRSRNELGVLLGTTGGTLYHWIRTLNAIPFRRIVQIEQIAAARGIDLPPSFVAHKAQVYASLAPAEVA